jgi:bifunctional DNA-binding transcriptional regulator/antitoxin component of YhaV-PrlF toxin-antitoxin module
MTHKFVARVISERRVTIPYEVCELLGIEEGDLVEMEILQVRKGARQGQGLATEGEPRMPPEVAMKEARA